MWEFAPAAVAGASSRGGHTRLLRSVLVRSDIACGLTFQAAAWAPNLADRAPSHIEVAAASARDARRLPQALDVSVFAPKLKYLVAKGVPVLPPTSVLVHMAATPGGVRSWSSALDWFPDVAAEVAVEDVLAELNGRPTTVSARLGYLLQGLRPDIADQLTVPSTRTWFGPRRKVVRHDSHWQIADTLLPFDPRTWRRSDDNGAHHADRRLDQPAQPTWCRGRWSRRRGHRHCPRPAPARSERTRHLLNELPGARLASLGLY